MVPGEVATLEKCVILKRRETSTLLYVGGCFSLSESKLITLKMWENLVPLYVYAVAITALQNACLYSCDQTVTIIFLFFIFPAEPHKYNERELSIAAACCG